MKPLHATTAHIVLALLAAHPFAAMAHDAVRAVQMTPEVAVSGQVVQADLATLKEKGYKVLVALRPDGEAPDQPTAASIGSAAQAHGMRFAYIPVPPGEIGDTAVVRLREELAGGEPTLIYCRSGSRAARTWALAEASRPGGLDAPTILGAVRGAGQSVERLEDAIARRVSQRAGPTGAPH